jgi:hypothetical protein
VGFAYFSGREDLGTGGACWLGCWLDVGIPVVVACEVCSGDSCEGMVGSGVSLGMPLGLSLVWKVTVEKPAVMGTRPTRSPACESPLCYSTAE